MDTFGTTVLSIVQRLSQFRCTNVLTIIIGKGRKVCSLYGGPSVHYWMFLILCMFEAKNFPVSPICLDVHYQFIERGREGGVCQQEVTVTAVTAQWHLLFPLYTLTSGPHS